MDNVEKNAEWEAFENKHVEKTKDKYLLTLFNLFKSDSKKGSYRLQRS